MFSALEEEKTVSRPFVFKTFSALGVCAVDGHKVVVHFVLARLGIWGIINSFVLRVRGGGPQD